MLVLLYLTVILSAVSLRVPTVPSVWITIIILSVFKRISVYFARNDIHRAVYGLYYNGSIRLLAGVYKYGKQTPSGCVYRKEAFKLILSKTKILIIPVLVRSAEIDLFGKMSLLSYDKAGELITFLTKIE